MCTRFTTVGNIKISELQKRNWWKTLGLIIIGFILQYAVSFIFTLPTIIIVFLKMLSGMENAVVSNVPDILTIIFAIIAMSALFAFTNKLNEDTTASLYESAILENAVRDLHFETDPEKAEELKIEIANKLRSKYMHILAATSELNEEVHYRSPIGIKKHIESLLVVLEETEPNDIDDLRHKFVEHNKQLDNVCDLKFKDMSDILETSEGALKASYHIAVKKIQDYLTNN